MMLGEAIPQERCGKNAAFEPTLSAEAGSARVQALGDLSAARKVLGGRGFAQRSPRISPGNSVRRRRAPDGFGDNAGQRSHEWWSRGPFAAQGR